MEPLRGIELRSAVVLLLVERHRPLRLADLVAALHRDGHDLGDRPSKAVSDALRWEVARGRAVRVGRGIYGPGVVAKSTKHRMRARVAATRNRTTRPVG